MMTNEERLLHALYSIKKVLNDFGLEAIKNEVQFKNGNTETIDCISVLQEFVVNYVNSSQLYKFEELHKVNEWILFKKREATKEEKEMYQWDYVLDCEIPNDGQEILVSDGEVVWSDVFINFGDCYGLESNTELTGLAWMPLPEPYKRKISKQ
ncbi:hypothetical protein B5F09_06580 [Erysipelatoclostridium sp. An173]|uniref:hypothetical protein n=1 Tax=Erysipelatoclostridium sp. An173 TaxID=1965571 RepID=UPI000B3B0581|nr:hypothetical protein [Erysipelatoclostridium sp. An173]OUP77219.1 hypothetical protein B5F09_06580 [Erysipelatoclostridium sp. An173]